MSSVLGVTAINFFFTVAAILYYSALPGYVKWPAEVALGRTWWYMSDNWYVAAHGDRQYVWHFSSWRSLAQLSYAATSRAELYFCMAGDTQLIIPSCDV